MIMDAVLRKSSFLFALFCLCSREILIDMSLKSLRRHLVWYCLFCLATYPAVSSAQIVDRVFRTDYHIDPEKAKELSVEIDNISFFKDNEYSGKFTKGYSLPGLWIQPKAVYYALPNIKLEAGIHALIYHGANKYPSMAYRDIATWKGSQYQKGVHLLPCFRAQMALSDHVDIILGNLYGASNHNLIEPLYNPELNLTSDPEAGLQLLYNSKHFDLDVWVNWESFIFRKDIHQEAFTVGLSTRVKYNDPSSKFHFYSPLQVLAQHRGGEIDTIYHESVQTLMNGAIGFGTVWNTGNSLLRRVELEIDAAGYYQQSGNIWPFDSGFGVYARAAADIKDFRIKAAYWKCDDFISMFGSPFYGAASTITKGLVFDKPGMIYIGAEYSRQLAKGFSLGIDVDIFQHLSGKMIDPEDGMLPMGSATSFTAGVYMRINPSFLIKKF